MRISIKFLHIHVLTDYEFALVLAMVWCHTDDQS